MRVSGGSIGIYTHNNNKIISNNRRTNGNIKNIFSVIDEDIIRYSAEKRVIKAFGTTSKNNSAISLTKEQIKEQIQQIRKAPIEVLKRFLPNNHKAANVNVFEVAGIAIKRIAKSFS